MTMEEKCRVSCRSVVIEIVAVLLVISTCLMVLGEIDIVSI